MFELPRTRSVSPGWSIQSDGWSGVFFPHRAYWAMRIIAIEMGPLPAAKGEPATAVNAPVEASMIKAETLLDPSFAT